MPDVHLGKGVPIGFTQKLDRHDIKICPNFVSVDIGCRVSSMKLPKMKGIDFPGLDKWIRNTVPLGAGSYKQGGLTGKQMKLLSKEELDLFGEAERLIAEDGEQGMKVPVLGQLFSLGGGNHFISLNKDPEDNVWLSVHSGSRNFGLAVAVIYQRHAEELCKDSCEKEMRYLDSSMGPYLDHYLRCVEACQAFSGANHRLIMEAVGGYLCDMQHVKFEQLDFITTLHNYIDLEGMVVRKGAVSAREGERFLLPFNMRDGIAVCVGKGNEDWNWSAPHGAGRIMSRSEAKQKLNVGHEKKAMEEAGVFTTSLDYAIDEAASAYKDKGMIMECVAPTAEIKFVMREIYNVKGK
ncbi:MAG: RtcB family protein [Clostridia bacterium]|nr:RtcB family protein [Clostridia bacterium]